MCKNKGIKLKDLLEQAHVSKTAFYSMLNNEFVLPRSIHSIASALGVKPSAFLEEESPDEKDARELINTMDTILKSVKKTGKVLIVHEDNLTGGFGGEIAARIVSEAFEYLDAPIKRVAGKDSHIPYHPNLENNACSIAGF